MKAIIYAGGELVTGDAVAAAVLDYAEALAQHGSSAQVSFPALGQDGDLVHTTVLIGPASQIMVQEADEGERVFEDHEVAHDIRVRAHTVRFGPSSDGDDHDVQHGAPARWVEDF